MNDRYLMMTHTNIYTFVKWQFCFIHQIVYIIYVTLIYYLTRVCVYVFQFSNVIVLATQTCIDLKPNAQFIKLNVCSNENQVMLTNNKYLC